MNERAMYWMDGERGRSGPAADEREAQQRIVKGLDKGQETHLYANRG
jgi:hypothetical protein